MGYQIERGGVEFHKRFLKNPDYKGSWPSDSDWSSLRNAHVFENENDAHRWVRENKGEGQLGVVDEDTGNLIEDPREGFDSTVDKYLK